MKILIISLGCDKNLVDTEKMIGLLSERGYEFTDDEAEAEAIIVNTCCFIGDAKEESINTLLEMGELRKSGKIKALIASGCLSERYKDEIQKEIPEVDALIGTMSVPDIADTLDKVLKGTPANSFRPLSSDPSIRSKRVLTTGGHFAYLKIAEGCDKNCTYCIIPKVRGGYRSVPMEDLVSEAEKLAQDGVKELILVAQETTLYGKDLYGKKSLPELLRRLCKISGLYWIRILYCYPEEITDELIDTIASEKKICHYLDIPIQHASDDILRRMGRWTNQKQLRDMIEKLRDRIPDIALRTTLISGFPGETQEDFEELYRFVNDMEFDRLGVFPYSREEDTVAGEMKDQIDEEVKKFRRDELMEYLKGVDIGTLIHYPIPPHLSEAYAYLGHKKGDFPIAEKYADEVLSLPMYNGMYEEEQTKVIEAVNGWR